MKKIVIYRKLISGILFFWIIGTIFAINTQSEWRKIIKNGWSEIINVHNECRIVTNNRTDYDIFVPTSLSAEWLAFRNNPPTNVGLGTCGCFNNTDCSAGFVCTSSVGICTWSAVNPCDTVRSSAYMLNTDIKVTSCSIYSYWPPILQIGLLLNTPEIIALDWWTTNSNYWDPSCETYLWSLCDTLTNSPGSALHSKLIESSTIDKRKITDSCGSNTQIVSGRTNTNALKYIRCYYSTTPASTCNAITSLNQCTAINGCKLSIPWTCISECIAAWGTEVNIWSINICRFNASICPSGRSQYQNWSTTSSNTCGWPDCGCPWGCTTSSHSRWNINRELCEYTDPYCDYCYWWNQCQDAWWCPGAYAQYNLQCNANITQIWCIKN